MSETARRSFNRLPRERRVDDIERAARAAFSEKGYSATSIADIAAGAGVVEGTIYKYFENKRDLLFKVLGRWYQESIANYMNNLENIEGVRNRLRFVIGQHLNALKDDPDLSLLMFIEVRGGSDYLGSPLHQLNREYTRVLAKVIREGIEAGEFRADTPIALVRDMVLGGIEHHMLPHFQGRTQVNVERVADALTSLVMAAVSAPASAAAPLEATIGRLDRIAERLEAAAQKAEKPR
jgi:AcrR family transcriptional regulator